MGSSEAEAGECSQLHREVRGRRRGSWTGAAGCRLGRALSGATGPSVDHRPGQETPSPSVITGASWLRSGLIRPELSSSSCPIATVLSLCFSSELIPICWACFLLNFPKTERACQIFFFSVSPVNPK